MNIDLDIGTAVRIERSSGEIQTAWICSVEPEDSENVVVQWDDEENGATITKQKEVPVNQIVALNPEILVSLPNFDEAEADALMTTTNTEYGYAYNLLQIDSVSGGVNVKIDVDTDPDPDSTVEITDGGSEGSLDRNQIQVDEDPLGSNESESNNQNQEDGCLPTPNHGNGTEGVSSSTTTFRAREYSVYQQETMSGNANWVERVEMMQTELHGLKKKQDEDFWKVNYRLNSIDKKQSQSRTEAEAAFGAFKEMTVRQGKMEELLLKSVDGKFFRQKISEMEQQINELKATTASRPHAAGAGESVLGKVKCPFCHGNFCKSYVATHKRKHCKMNPGRIY